MGMETRKALVTVGMSDPGGCGEGTWHQRYVDIPEDTPESAIPEVAIAVGKLRLLSEGRRNVAFVRFVDVLEPGQEP